jgi:hypothetical protein
MQWATFEIAACYWVGNVTQRVTDGHAPPVARRTYGTLDCERLNKLQVDRERACPQFRDMPKTKH